MNDALGVAPTSGALEVSIVDDADVPADDANFWGFALERNGALWATTATTQTPGSGGVGSLGSSPVVLYSGMQVVAGDSLAVLVGPVQHPPPLGGGTITLRVCE